MKATNDILTTKQKLEAIKYECYRNGFNYDKAIEAAENMNGEDKENYVNILSDYIYDKIIEKLHNEVTRCKKDIEKLDKRCQELALENYEIANDVINLTDIIENLSESNEKLIRELQRKDKFFL